MFTRRVPRDHAERGKHSARGADVVSRTGAAPGNESQARRRSRRPLPGRAAIGALTVENGQGNVASDLPRFLHIDANRTSICVSVTPSVYAKALGSYAPTGPFTISSFIIEIQCKKSHVGIPSNATRPVAAFHTQGPPRRGRHGSSVNITVTHFPKKNAISSTHT